MKRQINPIPSLISFAAALSFIDSASADTLLSAFQNFNLDGLFSSWVSAAVDSTPTNYSITASGFGSGYKALSPVVDASGETNLELMVTLSASGAPAGPISGPIVSLVDSDGTFYNYAWYGQTAGTHILRASLSSPTFITAAGSVPGLDLSKLAFFHLQDDPGTYAGQYTITFGGLGLTGAAPPAILSQSYDVSSQQFTLSWSSRPGATYTIAFTADLSAGFSPLMTNLPSAGTSTTATLAVQGGQSGFLRVAQQ